MVLSQLLTVSLLSVHLVTASPVSVSPVTPTLLNQIKAPDVAFASLVNQDDRQSLFLTAFSGNPFVNVDGVSYFPEAALAVQKDAPAPIKIDGAVTWPNTVTDAPESVFQSKGVVVAGGFLVPGKSNGGFWFSPTTGSAQGKWIKLFQAKNYFYHQTTFYDVDKDGHLDILTCRTTTSMFGGGKGDLTYLVPKDRANPTGPWVETVLNSHCDTFFSIQDLDGDGIDEIVAAEFWSNRLSVITTSDPKGSFANPAKLNAIVIDATPGHLMGIQVTDLNGDGKLDVLVTNHQGNDEIPVGSVFAYEVPSSFDKTWVRHTLASKFEILQGGFKQAAPGAPKAFHPVLSQKGKPFIALAGDGSQKAYLLTPDSNSPHSWDYSMNLLHDCKSTVGGIAVGDVTGSGYAEIFIPCYDSGYLAVYTFEPTDKSFQNPDEFF